MPRLLKLIRFLASFFAEIPVEYRNSEVNTGLAVTIKNGRYLLNSKGLNYSYGTLQKAFDREFRSLNFNKRTFNNILMLGFGGGSVIETLKKKYSLVCRITSVEKDSEVIELANKYFKIDKSRNLNIIHQDAVYFLKENTQLFDLILVDIYIGNDVPESCETEEFLQNLKKALSNQGIIIFNKFIYDHKSHQSATELIERFKKVFGRVTLSRVNKYMIIYE
jgi:spermidine synthase